MLTTPCGRLKPATMRLQTVPSSALGRALAVPLENVGATYGLIEVRAWKDYERVLGVPTKKMARAMERFDNTGKMTPSRFRIKVEPVA
jgi:hypothetical protein